MSSNINSDEQIERLIQLMRTTKLSQIRQQLEEDRGVGAERFAWVAEFFAEANSQPLEGSGLP